MDGNIETLGVLKRGCTFGVRNFLSFTYKEFMFFFVFKEKGLMMDSTQNFTVVAKTKLELLVLWKDVSIYTY
jgi:hypothetical protein